MSRMLRGGEQVRLVFERGGREFDEVVDGLVIGKELVVCWLNVNWLKRG